MRKLIVVAIGVLVTLQTGSRCVFAQGQEITRPEMLRGTVTPEREWWDVLHYDLKGSVLSGDEAVEGIE
jgi:hypothetical protein